MIVHLTSKFPAHEIYIFPVISCVCWLIQLRYLYYQSGPFYLNTVTQPETTCPLKFVLIT